MVSLLRNNPALGIRPSTLLGAAILFAGVAA